MATVVRFTTLDDAFFFLNQSKSIAETPSSQPLRQRYIRACILFSWISLEESLDHRVEELQKSQHFEGTVPKGLFDKLEAAVQANGHTITSSSQFYALRRVRNSLTHPDAMTDERPLLTLDSARDTFNYCSTMMSIFLPSRLEWR
jgi:hypothetical protein